MYLMGMLEHGRYADPDDDSSEGNGTSATYE
jgi:hypothetical protein